MCDSSDMELVRDYVRLNSEAAFAEVVQRHIGLVYSAALRHVGVAAQAEEIAQAVFIILARKAASLRADTLLDGWLFETTRLTALSVMRSERRRQFREQEAYMQSTLAKSPEDPLWPQLAPLLDEAMSRLGKKDRDVMLLRYFKGKPVREVAAALQINESAAQHRILRGLEKLRKYFAKRGVSSTAEIIAGAISANSVQTAPVMLAKSVTAVAVAKGATAATSTLTLVKGALKIMAWTKTTTAVVAGVAILAVTSTTVIGIRLSRADHPGAEPESGLSLVAQTMTIDIQPDGAVLFEASIKETNNTSQTFTFDNVTDGDAAWRVTDESGRPMKISKRGRGGIVIKLDRAVPPGGENAYKVEGKIISGMFNTNGAGECDVNYSDHPGNVTEMHVVRIMRLPPGATLLEKNHGIIASTNENGRIELTLDEVVPPNGTFPTKFRYRLPTGAN
jgi:RNA polymerase sigma factor (sigma-70 family)